MLDTVLQRHSAALFGSTHDRLDFYAVDRPGVPCTAAHTVRSPDHARHAIKAARGRHLWGPAMAERYAENHDVPALMYQLACEFEDRRK